MPRVCHVAHTCCRHGLQIGREAYTAMSYVQNLMSPWSVIILMKFLNEKVLEVFVIPPYLV